jgi:hypothetical protein
MNKTPTDFNSDLAILSTALWWLTVASIKMQWVMSFLTAPSVPKVMVNK